jgi:ribosomal protein S18 acetylase RimI-like enzyme
MDGQVKSLQLGENYEASNDRAYWSDPRVYDDRGPLIIAWHGFRSLASQKRRRRAVFKTYVDRMCILKFFPVEAVIPVRDAFLVYISQNNHQQLSVFEPTPLSGSQQPIQLPEGYTLQKFVTPDDVQSLFRIWEQFGWTEEGVASLCEFTENQVVTIRHEGQVVGATIAESGLFGSTVTVEITELAVASDHQGRGLATVLTSEMVDLCVNTYGQDALIFGEFNLTTNAHHAALRSGMIPGTWPGSSDLREIDGVLRDHVEIQVGEPKMPIPPWQTQYLHSYQVLYRPPVYR